MHGLEIRSLNENAYLWQTQSGTTSQAHVYHYMLKWALKNVPILLQQLTISRWVKKYKNLQQYITTVKKSDQCKAIMQNWQKVHYKMCSIHNDAYWVCLAICSVILHLVPAQLLGDAHFLVGKERT